MKNKKSFINPLTDFGFKRIFGSQKNKDLLIGFLNACISQHVGVISDVLYLPTEHFGGNPIEKKIVFDIYCTNQDNKHFIIEMQRGKQNYFAERVVTYVSRIVSKEAEKGKQCYDIPNIYSLNILDFKASEFCHRPGYFWTVQLKDDDNMIFTDKIAYYFVELTKFAAQKKWKNFDNEMQRWLYLLKHIENMNENELDAVATNKLLRKFVDECRISNLSTMEKQDYEKSVLEYEDVQEAIECERRDSLAEATSKRNIEIVNNMLAKGLDIHLIAEITNLTEEEIEAMRIRSTGI